MSAETNEEKLNRYFPFRGPCGICGGPDARHRLWDAITDRYGAGETIDELAKDYDLNNEAVESVLLRKRGEIRTMPYHGFPSDDGWQRLPHAYVLNDEGEYEWNRLEEVPGEPPAIIAHPITNAEAFPPGKIVYLERRGDWIVCVDSDGAEVKWPLYYVWVRKPKAGEILSEEEMHQEEENAKSLGVKPRKFLTSP